MCRQVVAYDLRHSLPDLEPPDSVTGAKRYSLACSVALQVEGRHARRKLGDDTDVARESGVGGPVETVSFDRREPEGDLGSAIPDAASILHSDVVAERRRRNHVQDQVVDRLLVHRECDRRALIPQRGIEAALDLRLALGPDVRVALDQAGLERDLAGVGPDLGRSVFLDVERLVSGLPERETRLEFVKLPEQPGIRYDTEALGKK